MATCLTPWTLSRFQASNLNPIHRLIFPTFKCNHHFSIVKQNSGAFISALGVQNDNRRYMDVAVHSSAKPDPSRGSWKVRMFGMIMRIVLPFWKEKIETAMDTAERVAKEAAEDVAKVAEGAVNHLPEVKLHDAAESAGKLAEEIDKDAQQAEKRLQKVEELGKEVKSFVQSNSQENAL